MSSIIFVIGIVVFACTVYGTVVAGGNAMTRAEIEQNPNRAKGVDKKELKKRFPKIKY